MMSLLCFVLTVVLSGCNNSDDVQKIFTGKKWRMTYITKKNDHVWYQFPGVDSKVYDSYMNGIRAFTITFTGSTDEHIISGDFNATGSVTMSGTWRANGKSKEFWKEVKKSSVTDSKDTLGKYIIKGITEANSYDGDENNLYLYFEYDKEVLCFAFKPER